MALLATKVHFGMHNWRLAGLPKVCVCGAVFTTEYTLTCPTGRVTIMWHNELTANLLSEVCHDVCVEPRLQLLSVRHSTHSAITDDNARLDIPASGFWRGRFKKASFNMRVFRATCCRQHEHEKRHNNEEWIQEVEHTSFVPLVIPRTGGAGPYATNFFKRVEAMQADKHHSTYSTVMALIHCKTLEKSMYMTLLK